MPPIRYSFDSRPDRPRERRNAAVLWIAAAAVLVLALVAYFTLRPAAKPKTEPKTPASSSRVAAPSPYGTPELAVGVLTPRPTETKIDQPQIPEADTEVEKRVDAVALEIRRALDEKDPVAAKKLALTALKDPGIQKDSEPYRKLGRLIGEANLYILTQGVPNEKNERYTVRSGDSLYLIAIRSKLPMEAIRKANKLPADSQVIHPGQVLSVYRGDWRIEVGKAARLLAVYDGAELFKLYDIGIGKEGRTPTGEFLIEDKIKDPPWYAPDGRIVPFGDKENVLGTRWLKLKPVGATDPYHLGYGIHGTWDDGSITRSLSNGCIRMRNADVEELFEYIPRQTPVKITD